MNQVVTSIDRNGLKDLARNLSDRLASLPRGDLTPFYGRDDIASVVSDLNLLIEGWQPSGADLAGAAHIERWKVFDWIDGGRGLLGWITRHPTVSGRVPSRTSGVVVVAEDLRWVRTIGRFYELGTPYDREQAPRLLGLPSILQTARQLRSLRGIT